MADSSEKPTELEKCFVLLYDWAKVWHKQAGGYCASDTMKLLLKCDGINDAICSKYESLSAFHSSVNK